MNGLGSKLAWLRLVNGASFLVVDFLQQPQSGGQCFLLGQSRLAEVFEQVCKVRSGRRFGILFVALARFQYRELAYRISKFSGISRPFSTKPSEASRLALKGLAQNEAMQKSSRPGSIDCIAI